MGEYRAEICSDQYEVMLHCHSTPPIEKFSRQWGHFDIARQDLLLLNMLTDIVRFTQQGKGIRVRRVEFTSVLPVRLKTSPRSRCFDTAP